MAWVGKKERLMYFASLGVLGGLLVAILIVGIYGAEKEEDYSFLPDPKLYIDAVVGDISFELSGKQLVREEITFQKPKDSEIKHGIIRGIPSVFLNSALELQNFTITPLEIFHLTGRGALPAPRSEAEGGLTRIYVGDGESEIAEGAHQFLLRYEVTGNIENSNQGQIYYFTPIDSSEGSFRGVTYKVTLPFGINASEVKAKSFIETAILESGPTKIAEDGKILTLYRPVREPQNTSIIDNTITFQTTRPTNPSERFGFEVIFPLDTFKLEE